MGFSLGDLVSKVTIGSVLCIGIALTDLWFFHAFPVNFAFTLLGTGLGGLLGYSVPLVPNPVKALRKNPTP